MLHEKLSTTWNVVSWLMNGASLSSPSPDSPVMPMFGTPQ